MSTQLKITVTKDIIINSIKCDTRNCAIAVAIRDIFPKAFVTDNEIFFDGADEFDCPISETTLLPIEAQEFIQVFDKATPKKRKQMDEISFNITIPDSIIQKINIDEIKPLLENHPTLQLINSK